MYRVEKSACEKDADTMCDAREWKTETRRARGGGSFTWFFVVPRLFIFYFSSVSSLFSFCSSFVVVCFSVILNLFYDQYRSRLL